MDELLKRLKNISTSSLADVDKDIRVLDGGIQKYAGFGKMVGIARVVSCQNDFLNVLRSLNESRKGEVLVIEARTSIRAVLGGLFCSEASRRGLSGVVVDGPIRDIECVQKLDIPVYARSLCPCAGTAKDLSVTKEPVFVGGAKVFSGDIVVGDKDGVIVGGPHFFQGIVDMAEEIEEKESAILNKIKSDIPLSSLLNLKEHMERLEKGENSNLQFEIDR